MGQEKVDNLLRKKTEELKAAHIRIDTLEKAVRDLTHEIDREKKAKGNNSGELAGLRDQCTGLKTENSRLTQENATLHKRLSDMRDTLEQNVTQGLAGFFVDVENLRLSSKATASGDPIAMLEEIQERFLEMTRRRYLVRDRYAFCPQTSPLKGRLEAAGYHVIAKNVSKLVSGKVTCNSDIAMAIAVIETVTRYDALVLMTGDGDFIDLIDWVRKKHPHVKFYICGVQGAISTAIQEAAANDLVELLTI